MRRLILQFAKASNLLVFVLLLRLDLIAQTTTGQNGPGADLWTDGTDSWDNGQPACGSHTNIIIPNGVTIIVRNTDLDLSACDLSITIESGGTLRFGSNNGATSSLTLSQNSTITVESGAQIVANTVGTSTGPEITITVGGNETWDGSDGNITDAGTIDENTTDGALPIELLSFVAKSDNDHVIIEWSTTWESGNDYFTLEKSENGFDFNEILTVEGAGYSYDKLDYSVKDYEPTVGTAFYRLRQTDFDGFFEIFEPIAVYFSGVADRNLVVYPNPASDHVIVRTDQSESLDNLKLFDLNGTEINVSYNTLRHDAVTIELGNLKAGIYFLKAPTQSVRLVVK